MAKKPKEISEKELAELGKTLLGPRPEGEDAEAEEHASKVKAVMERMMEAVREYDRTVVPKLRAAKADASFARKVAQGKQRREARRTERVRGGLIPEAGTGEAEQIVELIKYKSKQSLVGESRIGGVPDLPKGVKWSVHKKKKIPFIAQINLSEIPKYARPDPSILPAEGWLFAFALISNEAKHHPAPVSVFIHRGPKSDLRRGKKPDENDVWPDWRGKRIYDRLPITLGGKPKKNPTTPGETYAQTASAGWLFGEMYGGFGTAGDVADREFRDGDDWINLLAILSVGNMLWSDAGHLYLLIRRSDLEKGDFTKMLATSASS